MVADCDPVPVVVPFYHYGMERVRVADCHTRCHSLAIVGDVVLAQRATCGMGNMWHLHLVRKLAACKPESTACGNLTFSCIFLPQTQVKGRGEWLPLTVGRPGCFSHTPQT